MSRTTSSYWVENSPRAWQAFPYHWQIDPTEAEIQQLLHDQKGLVVRYSAPPASAGGIDSYHVIYDSPGYELSSLSKRVRKNIRRASRYCTVASIDFQTLGLEGWALQADTLERQGRQGSLNKPAWGRMCQAAADLPGFLAWGVFMKDRLVATILAFQMGEWIYLLNQASLSEYMPMMVNNILTFEVTRRLVSAALHQQRPALIFYGLNSLDAPASVDEFKFHLGYSRLPIRQRVVFHPKVEWAATPLLYNLLSSASKVIPSDYRLAKALGLLRVSLPAAERPDR